MKFEEINTEKNQLKLKLPTEEKKEKDKTTNKKLYEENSTPKSPSRKPKKKEK